jgi:hypothetical protein
MAQYHLGSKGPEVGRIQTRLRELGVYRGPIDDDFRGGTESAVRAFQSGQGLSVDGIVGPKTWGALFPGDEVPAPAITAKPLNHRCLALTGSFETGAPVPDCFAGLSGDCEGQGISFGVLQWNFGQGSLPPLIQEMAQHYPDIMAEAFGQQYAELCSILGRTRQQQLQWARSIQDPARRVKEPWRGQFKALGRRPEFQEIEVAHAERLFQRARGMCQEYEVQSERAVALMFDILTQNGSISSAVKARIVGDFAGVSPGDEVARLRIIANRRAEAARARWVEDVRARKLTIANGEGVVHGCHYHLADDFGIGLRPFVAS